MKAVIIAGGMGTRLRPLTHYIPKPIVPVVNIPFVAHQINLLRSHGIREIILGVHYLAAEIKETLGGGRDLGVKLHYSIEEAPLGTAGAVKNAEKFFNRDTVVVFNGDTLTDVNLSQIIDFHRKRKALATLTLVEVEDPTSFGLVITDPKGRIQKFVEKPRWSEVTVKTINAGIYVMEPKIFKDVPRGKPWSFEREVFPALLKAGKPLYAFVSHAYWNDIGSPEKYLQVHRAILQGDVVAKIPGRRSKEQIWWGEDCEISKDARLHGPSLIGQQVKIGPETYVGEFTVLGEGVEVGKKSAVERSVIWKDCKIGSGVVIRGAILGRRCVIEDEVHIGAGTVLADQSVIKRGTCLGEKR